MKRKPVKSKGSWKWIRRMLVDGVVRKGLQERILRA
jgi:hypothetical protein